LQAPYCNIVRRETLAFVDTRVGNTPIHTSLPASQSAFTGGANHHGMAQGGRNQWSIECGW
jgi:hypothetical protein